MFRIEKKKVGQKIIFTKIQCISKLHLRCFLKKYWSSYNMKIYGDHIEKINVAWKENKLKFYLNFVILRSSWNPMLNFISYYEYILQVDIM
jgi:hypothetical protein